MMPEGALNEFEGFFSGAKMNRSRLLRGPGYIRKLPPQKKTPSSSFHLPPLATKNFDRRGEKNKMLDYLGRMAERSAVIDSEESEWLFEKVDAANESSGMKTAEDVSG